MKKIVILGIGASMFFLGSCVQRVLRNISLYKPVWILLSTVHIMQNSKWRVCWPI